MHNILLIHYDNTPLLDRFPSNLKFNPSTDELNNSDIDTFISKQIIPQLEEISFDILCIKDTLSENYIDFYGLILAYHIRLNRDLLKEKSMVPIIILSDINELMINKLSSYGRLLFTKNIFLCKNNVGSVEHLLSVDLMPLSEDDYENVFIKSIHINQPQDYLTHHSIANEWSIYRWAEYLDVNTSDINKIRDDISSMLYFKYLQAKFPIKRSLFSKYKQEIQGKGKILYIDDEWEKGWKSIFEHLSKENHNYSLETVEEVYKDKSKEEVITFIMGKVVAFDPDIVVLDMRLHESDFLENIGLVDFTGIQIFNKIKELNPGIQIIIFTASSNSLLLDELYSYDSNILGYVKKEHPKNYNLTTQGNINKLISLLNEGFKNKYLKEIWNIKKQINSKLLKDPFNQYISDVEQYQTNLLKLVKESEYIFDILNSSKENKFNYALISLATSLDALQSIFIQDFYDRDRKAKDYYYLGNMITETGYNSLPRQISYIVKKSGNKANEKELKKLNDARNYYIHSNPKYIPVGEEDILKWFRLLNEIIGQINNQKIKKIKPQKQLGTIDGLEALKDKF